MHGDDHGAYDTDVLITGAGLTGLVLALFCSRLHGQNASRAVFHPNPRRVLDVRSVSQALTERGQKVAKVSIRDRERLLAIDGDRLPTSKVTTI